MLENNVGKCPQLAKIRYIPLKNLSSLIHLNLIVLHLKGQSTPSLFLVSKNDNIWKLTDVHYIKQTYSKTSGKNWFESQSKSKPEIQTLIKF